MGSDGAEYLVCLVSDGAGSATFGGEGAEQACVIAFESIEASLRNGVSLDDRTVEGWAINVRRHLYSAAEAHGRSARDYACTLLGALIGPEQFAFFQIGDGAIVATVGEIQGVVFWPDSGPYANMTYFVTDEDALNNLHVAIGQRDIDEIALFSDGVQRLALSFESQTVHSPFFGPMFNAMRKRSVAECDALSGQLAAFLGTPQVNERTDDDKTLILATQRYA